MSEPKEVAPTALLGLIFGGQWRYESTEGTEAYIKSNPFVLNDRPLVGPYGSVNFLSNLQKKSWAGFLIQKPWCFHFWIMLRPQKMVDGLWIPNSEFGYYLRIGWWRSYVPSTEGRHWMGPFTFHAGYHWD